MRSTTRRQFLANGIAGVTAAGYFLAAGRRSSADPIGIPIGLQLYTVRNQIAKDLPGTLKQVAAIGYKEVELYTFFDKKASELQRLLDDAGLHSVSGHFPAQALTSKLDESIEYAKAIGLKFMVCPFPGNDPDRSKQKGKAAVPGSFTMDDWKWNADLFNKAGEKAKAAGLVFAYHNHHMEFQKYGDETALDVILKGTDPKLVKLELDCGWVTVAGGDPAAFITEHADRVVLLHIKDIKAGFKPTTRFVPIPFVELGRGTTDWAKVFAAAKQAGVQRYYVEQDTTERPPLEAIKISYDYLHELKA